jgi:hypothetical protein
MSIVKQDFAAKLQTTKKGEIVTVLIRAGEEVKIVNVWQHHLLIRDQRGHFYNVPKELIRS